VRAALDGLPFPGEPLGCAMNIFRRSGIRRGDTVAIIGIGFLGALLVQLAAGAGARVIAISRRMHHASDDAVRADLRALPGHLDRIDAWIADGVLGAHPDRPNAADLQIGASLRLLGTIGDARPLLMGRPCAALATQLFPDFPGDIPAGALPAGWLAAA